MRKPLIFGNWKMNLDGKESRELIESIMTLKMPYSNVDVGVAPDFCSLSKVADVVKASDMPISVAVQNISAEDKGAFTGEVSAAMITSAGADTVIIGHSERRTIYGETDSEINAKVKQALRYRLKVILCVGELLEERGAGLADVNMDKLEKIAIAYEPVWAIGTGKSATPADAEEMHANIRKFVSKLYGPVMAEKIRIIYGGSVKPENISALMLRDNIDGALVGGASLDAAGFARLVNFNS